MLIDLDNLADNKPPKKYDVCVCGTGPAGITVARLLAAQGKSVLLCEGGALEYTEESQKLYDGKSIGINDWDAVKNCRLRYLGGTSNHWSGLCSYFDEIDFEMHPNGMSGWQVQRTDILKYFDVAKEILDLPKDAFHIANPWRGYNFKNFAHAMSPPTRFNSKYLEELKKSEKIDLFIHANLTKIQLNPNSPNVQYLQFTNNKKQHFTFSANQYVLALGALENARMLLANNTQLKEGIGNRGDMVGRCFMEHINIRYGRFVSENPSYWKNGKLHLNPSANLIKKYQIGNGVISFDPEFNAVSYGRAQALKQAIRDLICKSESATDLSRKLMDFDCPGDGVITSLIEQSPNLDSRVTLSANERDIFGIPKIVLDWRMNRYDERTVRTIGIEAAKEVAKLGIARVKLEDYILDSTKPFIDIGHHCHQMGTTRMSHSDKDGVVDVNLKVHGLNNLYIAGSSVFPTGGGCNPTFTVVMLSARLADHLASLKQRLI